jgi:hypothetical protein
MAGNRKCFLAKDEKKKLYHAAMKKSGTLCRIGFRAYMPKAHWTAATVVKVQNAHQVLSTELWRVPGGLQIVYDRDRAPGSYT